MQCTPSSCSQADKQNDAFLCKDALSMEKHVSSVYNTGIFEFTSPVLRDTLAHIQKEEQNHGEKLYNYLSCNNMYCWYAHRYGEPALSQASAAVRFSFFINLLTIRHLYDKIRV